MHEHDLDHRAVLIVIRRAVDLVQAERERERRDADQPWQKAVDERQEFRRIGVVDQGHRRSLGRLSFRNNAA